MIDNQTPDNDTGLLRETTTNGYRICDFGTHIRITNDATGYWAINTSGDYAAAVAIAEACK